MNKPVATLIRRRGRKLKLIKLEMEKGIIKQIPMKLKRSLKNTLQIYIVIS
jgi:hypothetical protein